MTADWQPIETAPRDGTFVLLTGGEPCYYHWTENLPPMIVGYWNRDTEEWVLSLFDTQCASVDYHDATHWAPLPEMPITSA